MDKVKITLQREDVADFVRFLQLRIQRHAAIEQELRAQQAAKAMRCMHGLFRETLGALHNRLWIAAPRFRFKEVSISIPKAEAYTLLAEYLDTDGAFTGTVVQGVCGQIDQALA